MEQSCSSYSGEKAGAVAGYQLQHEVNEEQRSADRYVPQGEVAYDLAVPLANMPATVAAGVLELLEVLELLAAASVEWEVQVEWDRDDIVCRLVSKMHLGFR